MDAILQTTFFKFILYNENIWISLKISLKFVAEVRIRNFPQMVVRLYLNQLWFVYWRIYASLGHNELSRTVFLWDCNISLPVHGEINWTPYKSIGYTEYHYTINEMINKCA